MIEKVISGGQTGADLAGLCAAKLCGIPTGGCMPKGFVTQDGPRPEYAEMFGVYEHPTHSSYPPRTEENVLNSDGTLILARLISSAGENLTKQLARIHKKPFWVVNLKTIKPDTDETYGSTYDKVVKWFTTNNIKVLNVAGNSERTAPGIGFEAEFHLRQIFAMLKLPSDNLTAQIDNQSKSS